MGILFGTLAVLFVLNVPLAFAVGLASLSWLLFSGVDIPLVVLAHRFVRGLDSFPLMAIPFFMLAGNLMNRGGIARRLVEFSEALVGSLKGGLAQINVVVSMFFAGMTGSATSDTSAVGSILIPAMIESGYKKDVAVAVTATSSVIGVIIPPSIVAVMYAIVAEISIGRLLLAGVIPGLLLGFGLMSAVAILARKHDYPSVGEFSLSGILRTFRRAGLALGTVIIVVGGIYGGIFTPTEASVIAVAYAFFLAKFVYRELKWSEIWPLLVQTAMVGSLGLFLLGTTNVFSWIVATQQIPQQVFNALTAITTNPTIIIIGIVAILLVVGTVLESIAAIIILVPILQPIGMEIGLDPIHFGMIVCLAIGLGLATPPVGVCLFVACGIADAKVSETMGATIPFFLVSFVVLLIVMFVPQLSLLIPNLML